MSRAEIQLHKFEKDLDRDKNAESERKNVRGMDERSKKLGKKRRVVSDISRRSGSWRISEREIHEFKEKLEEVESRAQAELKWERSRLWRVEMTVNETMNENANARRSESGMKAKKRNQHDHRNWRRYPRKHIGTQTQCQWPVFLASAVPVNTVHSHAPTSRECPCGGGG